MSFNEISKISKNCGLKPLTAFRLAIDTDDKPDIWNFYDLEASNPKVGKVTSKTWAAYSSPSIALRPCGLGLFKTRKEKRGWIFKKEIEIVDKKPAIFIDHHGVMLNDPEYKHVAAEIEILLSVNISKTKKGEVVG